MGAVFAAHHELLDITVALKVLSTDLTQKGAAVDRFLREARAVARLKSEHVVRVMDVGTLDTGQPFIVMERLEGEDVEHRLQRVQKIPVPEAVDIILQALEAMAHAHAAGIVHRDLKPANLFLATTPDGREVVKVLDFGIAKLSPLVRHDGARSGALTGEHAMLGSPSYMSPEQVRDSSIIDHRADIWALGVILYEIASGMEPFPGKSVGEIFGAILHAAPVPLLDCCPEAPMELETVVNRCLSRQIDERYPDVATMARELSPLGTGAWAEHAARMEQTLARALRASDPARGSMPSIPSGPGSKRTPTPSSRGPSSMPHVAFSRTGKTPGTGAGTIGAPGSDSLDEELEAAGVRRSHAKLAVAGLLFGAALVAAGVLGAAKLRALGRGVAGGRAAASPGALVESVPAPPSVSPTTPRGLPAATPSAAVTAPPRASLEPIVAGVSTPTESSSARTPAAPDPSHRPAKPPRTSPPQQKGPAGGPASPPKLPGVLDSPD
jgi:serine/threonine-protein kinase